VVLSYHELQVYSVQAVLPVCLVPLGTPQRPSHSATTCILLTCRLSIASAHRLFFASDQPYPRHVPFYVLRFPITIAPVGCILSLHHPTPTIPCACIAADTPATAAPPAVETDTAVPAAFESSHDMSYNTPADTPAAIPSSTYDGSRPTTPGGSITDAIRAEISRSSPVANRATSSVADGSAAAATSPAYPPAAFVAPHTGSGGAGGYVQQPGMMAGGAAGGGPLGDDGEEFMDARSVSRIVTAVIYIVPYTGTLTGGVLPVVLDLPKLSTLVPVVVLRQSVHAVVHVLCSKLLHQQPVFM
jgi:hypothetical protein